MEEAKRVVGYLVKMKHSSIRFQTGLPDYSDIPYIEYDWEHSVHGNVKEELLKYAPEPLGNPIILTHYVDAILYLDVLTGSKIAGIL